MSDYQNFLNDKTNGVEKDPVFKTTPLSSSMLSSSRISSVKENSEKCKQFDAESDSDVISLRTAIKKLGIVKKSKKPEVRKTTLCQSESDKNADQIVRDVIDTGNDNGADEEESIRIPTTVSSYSNPESNSNSEIHSVEMSDEPSSVNDIASPQPVGPLVPVVRKACSITVRNSSSSSTSSVTDVSRSTSESLELDSDSISIKSTGIRNYRMQSGADQLTDEAKSSLPLPNCRAWLLLDGFYVFLFICRYMLDPVEDMCG